MWAELSVRRPHRRHCCAWCAGRIESERGGRRIRGPGGFSASSPAGRLLKHPTQHGFTAAGCEARVLSLDGCWRDGSVERIGGWLAFTPEEYIKGGMSGSPIIDMSGKAIGVVSVNYGGSVLVDSLSIGLLRSIIPAGRKI